MLRSIDGSATTNYISFLKTERNIDHIIERERSSDRAERIRKGKANRPYPTHNNRISTNYFVDHPNYKRVNDYTYTHRSNPRLAEAIIYLREKPQYSMNTIARICDCSRATIHRILSLRRSQVDPQGKGHGFQLKHRRKLEVKLITRYKGVLNIKTMWALVKSFITGIFESIEEALGEDPP